LLSPEEATVKINFFLEMVDKKNTKEAYKILLKGYIFQHEEVCEIKDCPLKAYKKKIVENPIIEKEDEYKLLMTYAKILFEISINK